MTTAASNTFRSQEGLRWYHRADPGQERALAHLGAGVATGGVEGDL
jgi:hypothetical protein